jgi:hypothetical protein
LVRRAGLGFGWKSDGVFLDASWGRKWARQQGRTFLYKNDADFKVWASGESWQSRKRKSLMW